MYEQYFLILVHWVFSNSTFFTNTLVAELEEQITSLEPCSGRAASKIEKKKKKTLRVLLEAVGRDEAIVEVLGVALEIVPETRSAALQP